MRTIFILISFLLEAVLGKTYWDLKNKHGIELCPIIMPLDPQNFLQHNSDSSIAHLENLHQDSSRNMEEINKGIDEGFDYVLIEKENTGEVVKLQDSLCGNLCTSDKQCPAGKKCCPTTCGYACYNPVIILDT